MTNQRLSSVLQEKNASPRPRSARGSASRWITIAEAEHCFVRILNWGCPGGIKLRWRGRVDWCQPAEFVNWEEALKAIKHRLNLAGLEAVHVDPFSGPLPYTSHTVLCLVKRKAGTEWADMA